MIWSAATENASAGLLMLELLVLVDAGVCCLVMLEQVLLVCSKCGWLLCCHLIVSANGGVVKRQRRSSKDFLK